MPKPRAPLPFSVGLAHHGHVPSQEVLFVLRHPALDVGHHAEHAARCPSRASRRRRGGRPIRRQRRCAGHPCPEAAKSEPTRISSWPFVAKASQETMPNRSASSGLRPSHSPRESGRITRLERGLVGAPHAQSRPGLEDARRRKGRQGREDLVDPEVRVVARGRAGAEGRRAAQPNLEEALAPRAGDTAEGTAPEQEELEQRAQRGQGISDRRGVGDVAAVGAFAEDADDVALLAQGAREADDVRLARLGRKTSTSKARAIALILMLVASLTTTATFCLALPALVVGEAAVADELRQLGDAAEGEDLLRLDGGTRPGPRRRGRRGAPRGCLGRRRSRGRSPRRRTDPPPRPPRARAWRRRGTRPRGRCDARTRAGLSLTARVLTPRCPRGSPGLSRGSGPSR